MSTFLDKGLHVTDIKFGLTMGERGHLSHCVAKTVILCSIKELADNLHLDWINYAECNCSRQ